MRATSLDAYMYGLHVCKGVQSMQTLWPKGGIVTSSWVIFLPLE